MAVAAGIFQAADVAIPAVVAGATTARRSLREAAGVIVRQDTRAAAVPMAGKAFPAAAEAMADGVSLAEAAIMAEVAIMAVAAVTAVAT